MNTYSSIRKQMVGRENTYNKKGEDMSSRGHRGRRNESPFVDELRRRGATSGEIKAARRAVADIKRTARPSTKQLRHTQDLARSSATSPDDRRDRNTRTRGAQKRTAIREQE